MASAADAIGPVEPGFNVFVFTFGAFSLSDAIIHLLNEAGPSDVVVSTWSASHVELQSAARMVLHGAIRSMRWIVDRSFITRQPRYAGNLAELFGPECIRTTRTHAKFVLIRSDRFDLVVRTSMNLNHNPRLESLEVSDDAELADFFESVTRDIFAEVEVGHMTAGLPTLEGTAAEYEPARGEPVVLASDADDDDDEEAAARVDLDDVEALMLDAEDAFDGFDAETWADSAEEA